MTPAAAPTLDPGKTHPGQAFKHDRQLTRCRFSACGRYLFAGGLDGLLHRWELATGRKIEGQGHSSWIGGLAVHPRPEVARVFSADYHGTLCAWSHSAGALEPLWSAKNGHAGWIRALAVSPDGKWLATGGTDRNLRLWDAETGKPARDWPNHAGYVFSAAFHPTAPCLVSGDLFGVVRQWNVATGKLERELDAKLLHTRKEDFLADVGGVRELAFNADGSLLVCSGLTNAESNTFCPGTPRAVLLDWQSGQPRQQFAVKEKSDGPINAVRFLAGGTLVGTGEGASGGGLWFWKDDSAETVHSFPAPTGYDLDLHPDGLRIVIAQFETRGHSGNGRRTKMGEYIPHGAVLRIMNLYGK